jgi:hypothetical protein
MYSDLDEVFLGPETIVALPDLQDQPEADESEADAAAHRAAWARHALRANGFGAAVPANDTLDEDDLDMRDVIRQIFALQGD